VGRTPEILVIQHEPGEGPGTLGALLRERGAGLRVIQTWRGEEVPRALGDAVGLLVLGGGMGAYELDRHLHLRDEIAAIESALVSGRPMLGICLGSQLLAAALGARVAPMGHHEVGWHEVELLPASRGDPLWARSPGRFVAFHWHGDSFDLPAGAVRVASSARCENQAYRHGLAFGIQFHPEVDEEILGAMAGGGQEELDRIGVGAHGVLGPMKEHLPAFQAVARDAFAAWATIALADKGD
jgi:GMP synthase (glutamine-hydrolysing)